MTTAYVNAKGLLKDNLELLEGLARLLLEKETIDLVDMDRLIEGPKVTDEEKSAEETKAVNA